MRTQSVANYAEYFTFENMPNAGIDYLAQFLLFFPRLTFGFCINGGCGAFFFFGDTCLVSAASTILNVLPGSQ